MKKTILAILTLTVFIAGCKEKKDSPAKENSNTEESSQPETKNPDKSGNFNVDGVSFNGNSSTQYFGDKITGQFSILCQQDDPFALFQATFANEKSAKGNLKPADGFYSMKEGEAHISLSGSSFGGKEFTTSSNSTGSISIKDNKLVIKDLKLFNSDKQEKTVSATIGY